MIEKGRHQGLQENQRLCPFCDNKVENGYNFIMECRSFIEMMGIENFSDQLDENEKSIFILSAFFWQVDGEYNTPDGFSYAVLFQPSGKW